ASDIRLNGDEIWPGFLIISICPHTHLIGRMNKLSRYSDSLTGASYTAGYYVTDAKFSRHLVKRHVAGFQLRSRRFGQDPKTAGVSAFDLRNHFLRKAVAHILFRLIRAQVVKGQD